MSNKAKARDLRRSIEDGQTRVYCGECIHLGERIKQGYNHVKESICNHPDFLEIEHTWKERKMGLSNTSPKLQNHDNKCNKYEPIPIEEEDNNKLPSKWHKLGIVIIAVLLCIVGGVLLL